jgi:hypothetical protein
MCTFITLIAATDDLDGINAVLSRFDIYRPSLFDNRTAQRRAKRFETPHITAALKVGEREYLLGRGGSCDCGTYLGHAVEAARDPAAKAAAEIARYRRKGWPEAKIARAMQDRIRAQQGRHARPKNEDAAYWCDVLTALCQGLGLRQIALMHDFDRLPRGEKRPSAPRLEGGEITAAALVFATMAEGVIYDFACESNRVFTSSRR